MKTIIIIVFLTFFLFCFGDPDLNKQERNNKGWPSWGQSILNWNSAFDEKKINNNNVGSIVQLWNFTAGGFSARGTSDGSNIFIPDWQGKLWSLDIDTGEVNWCFDVKDFIVTHLGINQNPSLNNASRTSPTISPTRNRIYIATLSGAFVIALKANTGTVVWFTRVSDHRFAIVTASLTVYNDKIFGGVASSEESAAAFTPGYKCCTFRGSAFALAEEDGSLIWQTFLMPNVTGASGAALWGSQLSIDTMRKELKIATGNAYEMPDFVDDCLNKSQIAMSMNETFLPNCRLPGDLSEAFVSLDLDTGYPKSVAFVDRLELWNGKCGIIANGIVFAARNFTLCPEFFRALDYDFGQAPMLIHGNENTPFGYDTMVSCQKSGICYAFSSQTGQTGSTSSSFWATKFGEGGNGMFGSATDGTRIFAASTNSKFLNFTLQNGTTINGANWAAMNLKTGDILWQTPIPFGAGPYPIMGVTYANGVVYSGTLLFGAGNGGYFYALDANNGTILFSKKLHPNACGAPSIISGKLFIPCGYFTAGGTIVPFGNLFAYGLPNA